MSARTRWLVLVFGTIVCAAMASSFASAAAQPPVNLGKSATYGVFSQHVLNNSGTTNVTGDLGVAPPNAHALPTGLVVSGTTNWDNEEASATLVAVRAAYDDAMSRSNDVTITADLGGRTLLPGVYRDQLAVADTIDINGTLTLDARGDPNAVFIFQTPYNLVTGANSHIVLINGARFCRVFWAVRNANLGANSTFEGHILAAGTITAGQGATIRGQLMSAGLRFAAPDGVVTLNSNTIDNSICLPYTPRLPRTGYPPEKTSFPWGVLVALTVIAAMIALTPRLRAAAKR